MIPLRNYGDASALAGQVVEHCAVLDVRVWGLSFWEGVVRERPGLGQTSVISLVAGVIF